VESLVSPFTQTGGHSVQQCLMKCGSSADTVDPSRGSDVVSPPPTRRLAWRFDSSVSLRPVQRLDNSTLADMREAVPHEPRLSVSQQRIRGSVGLNPALASLLWKPFHGSVPLRLFPGDRLCACCIVSIFADRLLCTRAEFVFSAPPL